MADLMVARDAWLGPIAFVVLALLWFVSREIVIRRRLQEAVRQLRSSEERLRSVTHTAGDAIVVTDNDGKVVFANPEANRTYGLVVDGQDARAGVHGGPDAPALANVLADPGTPDGYLEGRRPDGSTFPVEGAFSKWHDDEGTFFTAILRDSTERARAKAELEAAEARMRLVFDNSPVALLLVRQDFAVIAVNAAAQALWGLTREEFLDPAFRSDQLYAEPSQQEAVAKAVLEAGRAKGLELRMRRSDDQVRLVTFDVEIITLEGQPAFLASAVDITERDLAERRRSALHAATQALAANGEEWATAVAIAAGVGAALGLRFASVWRKEADAPMLGCVDVWSAEPERTRSFEAATRNSKLASGTGLPGNVLAKAKPQWFEDCATDPRFPRAPQALADGLHAGFAVPIVQSDGIVGVVEFFSAHIQPRDDALLEMFAAVGSHLGSYIERRTAERRLREAYAELEETDRIRRDFVSSAVHELKTPLTPMLFQVQTAVLRAQANPDPELTRMLGVVDRNVRRLVHFVSDLLESARVQSRAVTVQRRDVDVSALAAEAAEAFKEVAGQTGVRIETFIEADRHAFVDGPRLREVFDNLLANACKFTHEGGKVELWLVAVGGTLRVRVRDEGIGLAPESLPRLFHAFSQVHDASQGPRGTGLGLYISRALIEAHGGSMGVESDGLGKGCTFWFEIPQDAPRKDLPNAASR